MYKRETVSQKYVSTSVALEYQKKVDRLRQLVQQRLVVQHQVARWKWNHKTPIEAPQREQELLAQVRQQAIAYGLDSNAVLAFFKLQIQSGKQIQLADFRNWHRKGVRFFADVPSLKATLRPLLDKLDKEILSVLSKLASNGYIAKKY